MQAFASATMGEIRQFNSRVEQLENIANGITPLPQFNEAPPDARDSYALANYYLRQNAAVDRYEQQKAALKQVQQKIKLVKQQETEKCVQRGQMELGQAGILALATPEEIKAAQDVAQARAIADKKRAMQGQINAVRWLQPQATNGDASAQCSLGMHYLNGQGCETNREQAIYWLQKAAEQGNLEASNKLVSLQK